MTQPVKTDHQETLTEIASNVGTCQRALKQLADTCCRAQRSTHMARLIDQVQALDLMRDPGEDARATDRAIAQVGEVGSALGQLFATCCTPTRAKLYILMFTALGDIHTGLYRMKGISH